MVIKKTKRTLIEKKDFSIISYQKAKVMTSPSPLLNLSAEDLHSAGAGLIRSECGCDSRDKLIF